MEIFFDSQIIRIQENGGISTLFKGLVSTLCLNPKLGVTPVLDMHWLGHLTDEEIQQAKILTSSSKSREADLFHGTYYLPHRKIKQPEIVTLHDNTHERGLSRNSFIWTKLKKRRIELSAAIVFASKTTRDNYFQLDPHLKRKTHSVITPFSKYSESSLGRDENGTFFLYVGRRRGYKSFDTILQVVALEKTIQVVIVGGEKPNLRESRLIREGRLAWHQAPSDNLLMNLIQRCKAVVSTSYDEGFGMVPFEASVIGCPTIVTQIPAHEESTPNSWFFTPGNAIQLRSLMSKSSHELNSVVQNIQARTKFEYAKEHVSLYRQVLSKGTLNQDDS